MEKKSIILGDFLITLDEINLIINGAIKGRIHLSHNQEPEETLADLSYELHNKQIQVVCSTPLTPRRIEILSQFLHMYELNIIKFLNDSSKGMTPFMFSDPFKSPDD